MLCPSCGAEIANDSYFCEECGTKLDSDAFSPVVPTPEGTGYTQNTENQGSYDSNDLEPLGLGDSLFRPFKDPEAAKKFLLGGLFGVIPFVGQILGIIAFHGFQVEYAGRIIRRDRSRTMPKWDDLSELLSAGIMLWLIMAIYGIVIYFVCGLVFVPFIGVIMTMANQLKGGSEEAAALAIVSSLAIPILISILIVSIFSMFATLIPVFYARKREFGDGFKLGQIWKLIMADFSNFVIISLALWGISLGVGLVGFIPLMVVAVILNFIPFIGQFVSFFLFSIVSTGVTFIIMMMTTSAFSEFYYKNRHVIEE